MTQMVKSLPEVWETWVQLLDGEDTLEKEMTTYSSILARKIPWTEEPGGYSPWGCKESDTTEQLPSLRGSSAVWNHRDGSLAFLASSLKVKQFSVSRRQRWHVCREKPGFSCH